MFFQGGLLDSEGERVHLIGGLDSSARTCFTHEGDLIESYNGKLRLWKRAFRTKGLPERNIIAQPAIRSFPKGGDQCDRYRCGNYRCR